MKTHNILILCASVQLIFATANAQAPNDLFMQNCAACHSIGNGRLVGPDLKGVTSVQKEEWLIKWVKSSQTLVNAHDKIAEALFKENNMIVMPDQPLSDGQIKSILGYITQQSSASTVAASADTSKPDPAATANVAANGNSEGANAEVATVELINPDTFFNRLWLGIAAAFFLVIVWVLTSSIRNLTDAMKKG